MPDRRAEEPQPDTTTREQLPAAPGHGNRPITDRELEVLTHAARGRTNREIGAALGISPMTVRNHMRTIQRKLATTDRTQAVVFAIGSGWIPIRIVLPHEEAEEASGVAITDPTTRPAEAQ